MINNSLNEIVNVNIDISSPVSNDSTFDKILLVVPEPKTSGEKETSKVFAVSKATELLDYGYTESESAYAAASVAFSQSPMPSELLFCVRKKSTDVYENITDTLTRALNEASFYGIHITEFKAKEDVEKVVKWTEANEKLFVFEYADDSNCPVTNFNYYRSVGFYSGDADDYEEESQPDVNKYAGLAWMAKCFGYDPGSESWHLKVLSGVVPSKLSTEQKKTLEEKHINTFRRYAGSNVTFGGYVLAGEWIDVIRFRDWLKSEIQTRVLNVIKVNKKVPYTDAGIGLVEGAMEAALKAGQDIGGIAPTEYDDDENVIPGYQVVVPRASSLTEEERKSRKLSGCYWSARLAGAIHIVDEIHGYLTF